MSIRLTILMSCYFLLVIACGEKVHLIGEWKRESNPNLKDQHLIENVGWGDLIFGADSTFKMQGDTTLSQVSDIISGWHAGGPLTGTWRLEENHLLLYFEDLASQFPIRYEIVQLSDDGLVLLAVHDKGNAAMHLTYSRKK